MPALTIPACSFSNGTKPTLDAGIESAIAKGGTRRAWSDFDRVREALTLVFEQATPLEVGIIRNEYATNRITGGMSVKVPWTVKDWALASNSSTAVASSTSGGFTPGGAITGDVSTWGGGNGWNSNGALPQNLEVDFAASQTISEIVVITLRDAPTVPNVPTDADTFTLYGITNFTVEYWTGSAWAVLYTVTGNNKVVRRFPVTTTTTKIRVNVSASIDSVARIVALQANSTTYTADYIAEPDIAPLPGSINSRVTLRLRT